MRDSSCFFSSGDNPIKISQLFSIDQRNLSGIIVLKKIVEVSVSGSEYFSLVNLNRTIYTY